MPPADTGGYGRWSCIQVDIDVGAAFG